MSTAAPARGKRLRAVVGPAEQRRLDALERRHPDSMARRRIRAALDSMSDQLAAGLTDLAAKVRAGRLRPRTAASQADDLITPRVAAAATAGFRLAGAPGWRPTDAQTDELLALVQAEVAFFLDYMEELAGEAARDRRAALYGGVVHDAMWRGWVGVLPSDARIHWRLGVAEHCRDCLALADGGPYDKPGGSHPLPTVPRNGDTRCLANCRCHLEIEGGRIGGLFSRIGVEVTAIGPLAVDPTSPAARAAAGLYAELAERYAYHLRMHLLDPGRGHDAVARALVREMADLAGRQGHTLRLTQTDAEILAPVLTAMGAGFRPVLSIDDDLVLAVATAIAMDGVDSGEITGVTRNPPTATLDGDQARTYRFDSVGRSILFLEDSP